MTVRNQQVEAYLSTRRLGSTQARAAARAGFSERTARRIERGDYREGEKARHWRTREDPFAHVWEQELEPLLRDYREFSATGLLRYLQKRYPGRYSDGQLRTLQRRTRRWRALHGADKEVMFRQEREMGRRGLSDFTRFDDAGITIRGETFSHCLYHFRLAFSGWRHVKVTPGSESYGALAEGLEEALWRLGGVPVEHRTDSLSAAYRNFSRDQVEDITVRYKVLCQHYGMIPTRNNRGRGHENGAIESPHGHLKQHLREALAIRGSKDFYSVAEYQEFIDGVIEETNCRNPAALDAERSRLRPLPGRRLPRYRELPVRVSTSATIRVDRVLYSVPARLIGERLRVHLRETRLECHLGIHRVLVLPRVHASGGKSEARRIDYRHVIGGLVEKPMAFYRAQLRDDILPNEIWRAIWRGLERHLAPRQACRVMVGALKLAAQHDCERAVENFLLQAIHAGVFPSSAELKRRFDPVALLKTPGDHGVKDREATPTRRGNVYLRNIHLHKGSDLWAP
uniref:Integrase core domain-containing protein n=1 Tax=Candidatus Kentrum sp. SD TaxID=2126332 RepID=A0A451BIY2_9GAMM|nr:MAG: Integrase core domain-containing protein [Candidatus Kentron sp. SD]